MCGVIVVDAGRSQSTNLGRDTYIHDHCLGYCHNYLLFYQLPNSNLFTHHMLFSRKKPLVKSTAPGSILYHICFEIYFYSLLFSDLLFQKPKNTLLHFLLLILFHVLSRSIYPIYTIFIPSTSQFLAPLPVEGLTTPHKRRVASIFF